MTQLMTEVPVLERMSQEKQDFIKSIRAMADWYEASELDEVTYGYTLNFWAWSRQDFAEKARRLGSAAKVADDTYYILRKDFGRGVLVDLNSKHEAICERVLVSEEVIPEHVIPAHPETIVPEKVVQKFEWRCPESVLAAAR